jgi:pyroglutamyl-peptidase
VPILVTGFEPFAGSTLNPSQLIVSALAESPIVDKLILAVLPVEYDQAAVKLDQLIAQHKPHTVICIGQAEGRASISIETRAQNLDDAKLADNSGETRSGKPISSDGETELPTTLPVDALLEQLALADIPAESSVSAGTFVCNHIFYVMQQLLADTDVRSGFIHVPLVPEQASEFSGKPTMSLETQIEAFTIVLSYLERER